MQQTLLQFIIAKLPELGIKTFQQIYLVGFALLLAIIIGVPLGIWAVRSKKLKQPILGFANVLQTIPSLALLAFFIPFLGIGVKPAIVTLSLYALLPIVRNTVTGIENVSKEIIEAADGLGFTRWQKLWMVELPLALPVIIAGIRTATAMSVGIATIAAFIGAGGLGDFIFQGISLNDNRLVMLGAIPAALLALILDYLIGKIEFALQKRQYKRFALQKYKKILLMGVSILVLISLLGIFKSFTPTKPSIRIATKNFTEQYILGYLMSDLIESRTGLKVIKKFNLGPTDICQAALERGEIDLYPEYTGTAYLVVLKRPYQGNAEQIYQQVKTDYQNQYQITWLSPFGFNNTQTLAVNADLAKKYNLKTISDLTPIAKNLIFGAPAEFMERPDAYPGLQRVYHLQFAQIRQMDPGLMYKAIANHNVDVIMAFSTDGRIAKYNLVTLQDDKNLFPPYQAAPIIRSAVLQAHPEILTALQPLEGLIDDKTMQQLNYKVDVEKQAPDFVAKNFLVSRGLLK